MKKKNYGPTSNTGFYSGYDPPLEGFTLIVSDGTLPYFYAFNNETELINYYNLNFSSVSTLDNVISNVRGDSSQALIAGLNVSSSISMGTNQLAVNLSANPNPQAQNKFLGLQGPNSDLKPQNCLFWACMVSTTVDYVAIYPGTIISEVQTNGNITTVLASTSTPTRGTLSVTAGRVYSSRS